MHNGVFNELMENTKMLLCENQEATAEFNLLKILGIAHKEVPTCLLLATLIDPHSHQDGQRCLKLFAETVLGLNPAPDLTDVRIAREKIIDNQRRIDVYIETADCKIPIEVKLYADDQPDQCFDYIKYAYGANGKLYYLSLDGHEPTMKSVKNTDLRDKVVCISFSEHIMKWLSLCQKECSQSLQPIINQFREVIEQNTGRNRETGECTDGGIVYHARTI